MEDKVKNVVIVGGGISGLTTLHYLVKKFGHHPDVKIFLLEKNSNVGGTIQTIQQNNFNIETGPNGFLNSHPQTLQLIRELRLEDSLVDAKPSEKLRFIGYQNKLWAFPRSPIKFFQFPLLNWQEKIRIFQEFWIAKGSDPDETIYDFGSRRFGEKFAQFFLGPMVHGIHGGDARQLIMRNAFPKIVELEQRNHSLLKALLSGKGPQKGGIVSFKGGMSTIIKRLQEKYHTHIQTEREVRSIKKSDGRFVLETTVGEILADKIIVCTASYAAAHFFRSLDDNLADHLSKITYAPIVVAGVLFKKSHLKALPEGFGYLNTPIEKKLALGVLFESNIFDDRCPKDSILFRVMLGGTQSPGIINYSKEELIQLALEEIKNYFPTRSDPAGTFVHVWPKGIPQYDLAHAQAQKKIKDILLQNSNLYLAANYYNGISFNDCIQNAYTTVENINLS